MISDPSGLKWYQIRSVAAILTALRRFGAALDASETGTGKTYVAIGVARELGVAAVIVCPKSVRSAWHHVSEFLGGVCHPFGYEEMKTGKTGMGDWELVRVQKKRVFDSATATYKFVEQQVFRWVWNQEIPLLVFDEAHRCKGTSTQNSKLMKAAKRQKIPTIVLSATIAENPLHMDALGYLLQLHDGKTFEHFCQVLGVRRDPESNREMFCGGEPALKKLHGWLYPDRGVRVTRAELGGDFPDSQITAELYDLPCGRELDTLYAEVNDALERLQNRMESDKDLEHPLTQLLRARQRIEILKAPLFTQLVTDALEEGMRPVAFLNFNESLDSLGAALDKAGVSYVYIRGDQTAKQRDEAIEAFQTNRVQVCIANVQAGGVGVSLHDLDGNFPRIAFISPPLSAIQFIQTLGRVWRQGAKSKSLQRVVLINGSVETKTYKKLQKKLDNISTINDGDLVPLIEE